MFGQGCPKLERLTFAASGARRASGRRLGGWLLLGAILAAASASAAAAAPRPVHLRFEWGGGPRRAWSGRVSIDRGRFSQLRPLGIEADEPGALWIEQNEIRIAHRGQRAYDAFDVRVVAEEGAILTVELGDPTSGQPPVTLEIPVAQVAADVVGRELDSQGNRLLVRRAPGDRLRVELEYESLVFAPGESFAFRLRPDLPGVAAGTPLRLVARLVPARGSTVLWSRDYEVTLPAADAAPLSLSFTVPLPSEEGAYDVQLLAFERGFRQRLVNVVLPTPLAERKVQVVVIAPEAEPAPRVGQVEWETVGEIDPAHPGWWRRLARLPRLTLIPGWPQGPLRSGDVAAVEHSLGAVVRFARRAGGEDTTWEAYPLPIARIGAPHILEIEYPSDMPQQLGISIIEPNASGAVLPIGLDSGVYVSEGAARGEPRVLTHRLVFWPKTHTPMVLLTQRGGRHEAAFRKIRVLAGPDRLPSAAPAEPSFDGRLIAGYFDRPLFPENFCATGVHDEWNGQTIDDWKTFYQGGARLADYLNFAGYNGLMLNVWGGGAIYPSETLRPTPRYDTGQLGTSGRDPIRKDVLEMLLRIFDRERLRLVPALQFAAPLPELERLLRRGDDTAGIELIGPDGATWTETHVARRGLAPYYNPLDERVQRAMLAVAGELAARCGAHPAFAGVAVQLSAETYARLPGPAWGLDDRTVARFAAATGIEVPTAAGESRFAERAKFLLGPQRKAWLAWRAGVLADFYRRMQQEVARHRPDAKLFLAAAGLFEGPYAQERLRPALPQSAKVDRVLLELGLQPSLYRPGEGVVLTRPRRIAPPNPLRARGVDLRVNHSAELDAQFAAAPAELFYHPRRRLRLRSFERQSPFGEEKTYALLVAQPAPSGAANRRRFARALAAHDATMLFDGGWLLPLGQEDALRRWFGVFRQLPAGNFQTSPASAQPITVRARTEGERTYVYLVNDSPWTVTAELRFGTTRDTAVAELTPDGLGPNQMLVHAAGGAPWSVTLAPFGLKAFRVAGADVAVKELHPRLPASAEPELNARIEQLGARAAALAAQSEYEALTNAGLEALGESEALTGWSLLSGEGVKALLDPAQPHAGKHALRLTSTRQVASLQSNLFDAPATGRLAVKVWLRAASTARQPVLRLALEGPADGKTYYRYAPVGGTERGSVPMQTEWTSYIFQVDDLPAEGVEQMRVRFDLMGTGTVWIDDVRLYHLKFEKNERVELSKILESARRALNAGDVSDCLRLLETYWPRFLAQHVEPVEAPPARQARLPKRRPPPPPRESPGALDRLRGLLPKWPF